MRSSQNRCPRPGRSTPSSSRRRALQASNWSGLRCSSVRTISNSHPLSWRCFTRTVSDPRARAAWAAGSRFAETVSPPPKRSSPLTGGSSRTSGRKSGLRRRPTLGRVPSHDARARWASPGPPSSSAPRDRAAGFRGRGPSWEPPSSYPPATDGKRVLAFSLHRPPGRGRPGGTGGRTRLVHESRPRGAPGSLGWGQSSATSREFVPRARR